MKKPVVLIIMDGYGVDKSGKGNAIIEAKKPNLDKLFDEWPYTTLEASGEAVGVPKGSQGSSEVGHLNIGAGRLVKQEVVMINESVQDKSFFENKTLLELAHKCREKGSNFHLMGLLSDKDVHSNISHLFALLEFCSKQEITPYVHAFTDGRDSLPKSAKKYFKKLDKYMKKYGGELKSIIGRYYSMDRDTRWDRTKLAYDALNEGTGERVSSWKEALKSAYSHGESDEFIKPRILDYDGMKEDDCVLFFNYRSDRPRQLTQALIENDFDGFPRNDFKKINFAAMVKYYDGMPAPNLFEKHYPEMGLGEYFSKKRFKQYRIAETEKYAHVTYFFSGERENQYENETRILVPSPQVATYDEKPEMSAYQIRDKCLSILDNADFVVLNFANCDMVGHTGDFAAAVRGIEVVDECIGEIWKKVQELGGVLVVTADHGNAERMLTRGGGKVTSHTTSLVPFCIAGLEKDIRLEKGKLGDIAPTILHVLGMEIPEQMTGNVLVK